MSEHGGLPPAEYVRLLAREQDNMGRGYNAERLRRVADRLEALEALARDVADLEGWPVQLSKHQAPTDATLMRVSYLVTRARALLAGEA